MTVILPAWDAPQFKYSLLDLTINRQRKEQHIHLETGCLKLYKPQKVQFTNLHISGWVWGFRYTFQMPSPNKSCPNTKGLTHFKGRITTFFFFFCSFYLFCTCLRLFWIFWILNLERLGGKTYRSENPSEDQGIRITRGTMDFSPVLKYETWGLWLSTRSDWKGLFFFS